MPRLTRLPLALALLALALGGCGASSAGISSSRDVGSFRALADGICARAQAKARAITKGGGLQFGEVEAAAKLVEQTEKELEALSPPPSLAAGYTRFLDLFRPEVRTASEMAAAVRRHELHAAKTIANKLRSDASNQAANKVGLTVCAQETG